MGMLFSVPASSSLLLPPCLPASVALQFFATLGPEELRKRGAREDKPVRMVKTILHEVGWGYHTCVGRVADGRMARKGSLCAAEGFDQDHPA